ncbi:MAG: aspartyl protease family protein [bacterium]|nr:aspartyl protease family protein [bacterium]
MGKRLTWKEFDYTIQIGLGNSWIYRPLIEVDVSLSNNSNKVRILAMIDSGTDGTVFDSAVAQSLGISPARCQKVKLGGIGSVEGFLSNVQLSVPELKTTMNIPVVFAEKLPMDGLLGQKHFFQRFRIRFEKDHGKFFLAAV